MVVEAVLDSMVLEGMVALPVAVVNPAPMARVVADSTVTEETIAVEMKALAAIPI